MRNDGGAILKPVSCFEIDHWNCVRLFSDRNYVREFIFCNHDGTSTGTLTAWTCSAGPVATMEDVDEEGPKGRQACADDPQVQFNNGPDNSIDVGPRWIH